MVKSKKGSENYDIFDLIEELTEYFIMINWKDQKNIDTVFNIIKKMKRIAPENKLIIELYNNITGLKKGEIEPDDKFDNKISMLIESLRNPQQKDISDLDETQNGDTKIIDDKDIDLYELFLMDVIENLDKVEENVLKLKYDKKNIELIKSIFRPFHNIKGVSASYEFDNIGNLAHKIEDILDLARNQQIVITDEFVNIILTSVDIIRVMARAAEEGIKKKQIQIAEIDTSSIIEQVNKYRIKWINEGNKEDLNTGDDDIVLDSSIIMSRMQNFIKIELGKMDHLIEMVSELVIVENMIYLNDDIYKLKNKNIELSLLQLHRVTKNIQDIAFNLRMIPIKDIFYKMRRVVYDYQKQSTKNIELKIRGEDTEIDRNMVEEIYDPLIHLIRNACDHGIESPEARAKKGKSKTGIIRLSAYYIGRNIVIEITDDGCGMDAALIRKKAIAKGIIKGNEDLSEQDIFHLIYNPALSTSNNVTKVSGRGVGMDVVSKVIKKLKGKIEIETEVDKGTTFRLLLPLTLAVVDGMVVKVGDERFIIPTEYIKKTFQPKEEDHKKIVDSGEIILYEDNVLNLVRLSEAFNIESSITNPWEGIIVIVEGLSKDYSIMVDNILGKQEVVIKNLGTYLKKAKGIAGGSILSDGKVGLIIDINELEKINVHNFNKKDIL